MLPTGINRPQVRAAVRSAMPAGQTPNTGIAAPVHAAVPTPQTPARPVMGTNKGEIGQPWNFRFRR